MEALTPRRRGRPFNTGNPGRRPGSKNRTTVVSEALLRGEATELVRKAIELAKGGNVPMLKVLVERILRSDLSRLTFLRSILRLKPPERWDQSLMLSPPEGLPLVNLRQSQASLHLMLRR